MSDMPVTAPPSQDMLPLIEQQIAATGLDLDDMRVVTEAATGAYATTAVIAAVAGAGDVFALARDTAHHGSAADAARETLTLADRFGVADRIHIVEQLTPEILAECDILTNSGHLRPITAPVIRQLPHRAVIALMFEAWEFRGTDLDLDACRTLGIRVAAVNERHPDVGVFPFLGPLCVRLLEDSGIAAAGTHVAVLCDNPFAPFIGAGLAEAGAWGTIASTAADIVEADWGAVVVALTPGDEDRLGAADFEHLAKVAPRALIAQFWGDLDRVAARHAGFFLWPPAPPRRGHMGILLNALGPEPIIRLQTGGLRAAELAARGADSSPDGVLQLL
ncbi:MAG TPA: hypothetical protein VGM83_21345 [Devosiaceae bacterium]|jgi:hypothetical protein